ncbi:M23 family metallopeptidase [Demequina activiva]|uniref:Peptidase n=1 Tax=Demequina activiva TaxID=1582364 RepID=A0A919Q045_9MICO|nr:M23 family metallopeptidase [Demequina activiva]GIG53249.1 peptidase [Demequina activiva]
MRRPCWPLLLAIALTAALVVRAPAEALEWRPAEPYLSPVTPVLALDVARIPVHEWLPGHRGIDLAAAHGQPVVAPAPGTVTFAGIVVNRPVLTVTHDDGARTSLEPVDATVEVGTRVVAGAPIGTVAQTPGHCVPVACVHWGVRVGERYVDPLDVLAGFGPVRLLPRDRGAFVT